MDKGFIKLSRKSFEHKFWIKRRVFSEFEAWVDLIRSARFEDTPKTEYISNIEVTYGRGQYPASRRFLAKRWSWGEQKVRNFLNGLVKDGGIIIDDSQGVSIITLCNYDKYNTTHPLKKNNPPDNPSDNPLNGLNNNQLQEVITHLVTQLTTQQKPTDNPNSKKERNNKKENTPKGVSKKEAALAATLTRKEEFYNSLIPFVEKYPKDMIRAFYDYWTELNKSQTKMRFELEKTWEVEKRLVTWANREDKFKPKNPTSKPSKIEQMMKVSEEATDIALKILTDGFDSFGTE